MTARPDAPAPLSRRGPRPLLLHLTLAMLRSSACLAEWPNSKPGSPNWNGTEADPAADAPARPGPHAEAHAGTGVETDAEINAGTGTSALEAAWRQQAALVAGIAAYRRHPSVRTLADPPAIWREGGSRLLDFGGDDSGDDGSGGPAALFVPSLVNRAYVLDLLPDHSMLRWLAAHGVRPLLLDWGWPGELERSFTLTDYVAGRLERALSASVAAAGGPVALVGYCMGGLLAVAAAQRRAELLRCLALLATPWDFHAGDSRNAHRAVDALAALEPAMRISGAIPVDALQLLFTLVDPGGVAAKYRAFARLEPTSDRARLFVALEDWLNDGIPLAAAVARECMAGWYGQNQPAEGTWRIAGEIVDPRRLRLPAFVSVPRRDRLVPPASARPLATLIEGARLHEPQAGHIGMVAGAGAERALWAPLREWLRQG